MPTTTDTQSRELALILDDIQSNLLPCTRLLAESAAKNGDLKQLKRIQQRLTNLINTYDTTPRELQDE